MVTLKGKQVFLRALEPEDFDFIFDIENNEEIWEVSNTQTPYSRFLIKQYLDNAHKDIYEVKQLRLVISTYDSQAIGMIDIFDFDFSNRRAGIGILIKRKEKRNKGFGAEALQLLSDYCFKHLHLHQLYCNISEDNQASIKLFTNQGFNMIGLKEDWNLVNNTYKNEYLFQLISKHVL